MRFHLMIEVVVFISIVLLLTSALFAYIQRHPLEPSIDSDLVAPTN